MHLIAMSYSDFPGSGMLRLPAEGVRSAIDDYGTLLSETEGPRLAGLYLVGSVALGAFQDGCSDIDFVAVLAALPDDAALDKLAFVHGAMASRGTPHFDGVYATLARLRSPEQDGLPTPFVVGGSFSSDRQCGDLNPVLRQCLVEHGLTLSGAQPDTLGIPAKRSETARYVGANLSSYWTPWIDQAERSVAARQPGGDCDAAALSWGALGVARIAATIETGEIISKGAAGLWAIDRFPGWREPLTLALAQRQVQVLRADLDMARSTLGFMRFVVGLHGS